MKAYLKYLYLKTEGKDFFQMSQSNSDLILFSRKTSKIWFFTFKYINYQNLKELRKNLYFLYTKYISVKNFVLIFIGKVK